MKGAPALKARAAIAILTCGSNGRMAASPMSSTGRTMKLLSNSITFSCLWAFSGALIDWMVTLRPFPSEAVHDEDQPEGYDHNKQWVHGMSP